MRGNSIYITGPLLLEKFAHLLTHFQESNKWLIRWKERYDFYSLHIYFLARPPPFAWKLRSKNLRSYSLKTHLTNFFVSSEYEAREFYCIFRVSINVLTKSSTIYTYIVHIYICIIYNVRTYVISIYIYDIYIVYNIYIYICR